MSEEEAMALSQELLAAADEDARARVVVHWLPAFARCQVKTAARVKSLCADVKALGAKMDEYHATKDAKKEGRKEDEAESVERHVPPILVWLGKNWTWLFIMILCLKNNGLVEIFQWLIGIGG